MTSTHRVRFTQSCPTCGRRVEIRASLLGCKVACQHCNAEFVASASGADGSHYHAEDLLSRVELALRRSERIATTTDLATTQAVASRETTV